jgi:hypothetical protein
MQMNTALRMTLADTERCVGPALAAPSWSLGGGWPPGHDAIVRRSADKPLDTLGALTHSTSLRVILSLSNG